MAMTRRDMIKLSGAAALLAGCKGGKTDHPGDAGVDATASDATASDATASDATALDATASDATASDAVISLTYEFIEKLATVGSFSYVVNSSTESPEPSVANGMLCNSDGSAFVPTASEYPRDGTMSLPGGRYVDIQSALPADEEWTIMAVYDVVMGLSYKMYALHYYGNGKADVWHGDESNEMSLSSENTAVDYTPPTETFRFTESPSLPGGAP